MIHTEIRKNAYYDSVTLMCVSKEMKKLSGIREALVGMGTELNREIAQNTGLAGADFDKRVTANDFFAAVSADDAASLKAAMNVMDALLNKKQTAEDKKTQPATLSGAVEIDPALNMAIISVPGRFAAGVARSCLDRGIHVMLFSDNVTIEEERELKTYAVEKQLLMMGPDCGTAIVNHVPLAFANVVRPGDIGIVAASGTGTQEVSSLIDRLGGGVSQVLGVGGRDLKEEIDGRMMQLALTALMDDPKTNVIVLVSKPPAAGVAQKILRLAAGTRQKVVVCFIGGDPAPAESFGLIPALSLEDAASKAVQLSNGEALQETPLFTMGDAEAERLARVIAEKMHPSQQYIRGYYTGGTLCDEAMKLTIGTLGHIYSNIPLQPADRLENARAGQAREHTFLDFGDDEFTVGRPHPMIDPGLRAERVVNEGKHEETAVVLVDCVIGYGSHEDPAEELSCAIRAAKQQAEAAGRYLAVVASVCGTEGDPQCLSKTQQKLIDAGAVVLPSNAQAARFALKIMQQQKKEGSR